MSSGCPFVQSSGLLGGSWVVISGVISMVTIPITHIRGHITLLITTHEPPSRLGLGGFGVAGLANGLQAHWYEKYLKGDSFNLQGRKP